MRRKQKPISINITQEEYNTAVKQEADAAIDQLINDPVMRELVLSMGVEPEDVIKKIKRNRNQALKIKV